MWCAFFAPDATAFASSADRNGSEAETTAACFRPLLEGSCGACSGRVLLPLGTPLAAASALRLPKETGRFMQGEITVC